MNEIDSSERYACSKCWAKVQTFHDFYVMVETNHQNGLINESDEEMTVNALHDSCEPKTVPAVGTTPTTDTESDRLDSSTSYYETIYISSTPYPDDSNTQSDVCREEKCSTVPQQAHISAKSTIPNQRIILSKVKRKNESNGVTAKSPSTELKGSKRSSVKKANKKTIGRIM